MMRLLTFLCCLFLFSNAVDAQNKLRGLTATELAAASQISEHISTSEWLGPLAPIALSPFFGITCLSGIALYGGDWIPGGNALLENTVVKNPAVFWTFLVLSILTSLPRFSKLSKPFAQAIDQLETYAGIITLLVIKFWATGDTSDPIGDALVLQAGVISITTDGLLAFAAMIKILVVNSVKFFFEFMIWITPVPFLDACFELANKSLCAVLMGIYAYSPAIATGINLIILLISLIIMRWAHRRVIFYRTMCLDPLLAKCLKGYGTPHRAELTVFPSQNFGAFPEKSRLLFRKNADGSWSVCMPRFGRPALRVNYTQAEIRPLLKRGWLTNSLRLNFPQANTQSESSQSEVVLIFSHRHAARWTELCECLGANSVEAPLVEVFDRKVEFNQ